MDHRPVWDLQCRAKNKTASITREYFGVYSSWRHIVLTAVWPQQLESKCSHSGSCLCPGGRNLQGAPSHPAAQTPTVAPPPASCRLPTEDTISIFPFSHLTALDSSDGGRSGPRVLFSGTWRLAGDDEFYGDTTASVITIQSMISEEAKGEAARWRQAQLIGLDFSASPRIRHDGSRCSAVWSATLCSVLCFQRPAADTSARLFDK